MVTLVRILSLLFGAAAFAAALPSAPLRAQGTVRGTLFDSLRTLRPVPGAVVTLGEGQAVALTDEEGEFVFLNVPAGEARVRWSPPWLDSLGIPEVVGVTRVRTRGETTVHLATPSARTFSATRCDGLAATDGLLMGLVSGLDGVPRPGAIVRVTWTQNGTADPEDRRADEVASARTRTDGMYALCGVPRRADLRVVASHGGDSSGVVTLRLTGRVAARQDLAVAPGLETAVLVGRVLRATGEPVADATVTAVGDPGRTARTTSGGEFRIDSVPLRTTQLSVRASGLLPNVAVARPASGGQGFDLLDAVPLFPIDSDRTRVMVFGAAVSGEERAFEERRLIYRGAFFDADQLSRVHFVDASSLFSNDVALRRGSLIRLVRSSCNPLLFVDGFAMSRQLDYYRELEMVRRARRIEIYEPRFMPEEFHDPLLCGSVVIWTD